MWTKWWTRGGNEERPSSLSPTQNENWTKERQEIGESKMRQNPCCFGQWRKSGFFETVRCTGFCDSEVEEEADRPQGRPG